MNSPTTSPPSLAADEYSLLVLGRWRSNDADAAAKASATAWEAVVWPTGLLAHSALVAEDGRTLAQLSLARSRRAFEDFDKQRWAARVDALHPGVERVAVTGYHPYRAVEIDQRTPIGCIVVVTFDTRSTEHAEEWIDAVADAATATDTPTGLLASRFHIAVDGTSLINYAEWRSVGAHTTATAGPRDSPVTDVIDSSTAVRFRTLRRFTHWWTTRPRQ